MEIIQQKKIELPNMYGPLDIEISANPSQIFVKRQNTLEVFSRGNQGIYRQSDPILLKYNFFTITNSLSTLDDSTLLVASPNCTIDKISLNEQIVRDHFFKGNSDILALIFDPDLKKLFLCTNVDWIQICSYNAETKRYEKT